MQIKLARILGPALFCVMLLFRPAHIDLTSWHVLAVALWMLIWWLTETVNLAVTALLPLVLFPVLGVMDLKTVATNYANPLVYLFFGGFVLALAIEKWNLHKRIALNIINLFGTNGNKILLGFMLATAFLSMWISNTATAVMMLPIALSVIDILDEKKTKKLPAILLIGVAWAANVGGMATLIGTPPNLVLAGFMKENYNIEIFFTDWLKIGFPVALVLFIASFFVLAKFIPKAERQTENLESKQLIASARAALGKIKGPELRVLIVFILTALGWIFRAQIVALTGLQAISDTTIAMTAAIVLFVIPVGDKSDNRILNWRDTEKLGWGILILFGGGLALAAGLQESVWLTKIGDIMNQQHIHSIFLLLLVLATLGVFLTEFISNMALVSAILPLVTAIALGSNTDFYTLALPITLGASCAFMLPMATPPNAIVYSSNRISIATMARYGFIMNIISVGIITLLTYALAVM